MKSKISIVFVVAAILFIASGLSYGAGLVNLVCDSTGCRVDLAMDSQKFGGFLPGDFAAAAHTHDAADIVSGTINTSLLNVGTGAGTVAAGNHNHDGVYQKKYGHVAVVAVTGGDYADPVLAMGDVGSTWCPAPSAATPCLLKIMPGSYNIGNLNMHSYVDIEGSGENVTKLAISGSAVYGANNSEIRSLTIEGIGGGAIVGGNAVGPVAFINDSASPKMTNLTLKSNIPNTGGTTHLYGVINNNSSPTMTDMTIVMTNNQYDDFLGGSNTYGVTNRLNSSPIMSRINITVSALMGSTGVGNVDSLPVMTDVTVNSLGGAGASLSVGVSYGSTSPNPLMSIIMSNVTVNASGAHNCYGVWGSLNGTDVFTNVIALASGCSQNVGFLFGANSGTTSIDRSTLSGSGGTVNNSIIMGNSNFKIGGSKLTGAVVKGGLTQAVCVNSYDGNTYAALSSTCQ